MLRQWVLRKSFNLFKNFGVWDIPGMLKLGYPKIAVLWDIPKRTELGYPNFGMNGPFCRGETFLKHEVPLKDSLLITYTKHYHSYINDNHSSTLR